MNRYYSILRSVSISTLPDKFNIERFRNYDYKTEVPEIQQATWGYFETPSTLTERECYLYGFVEEKKGKAKW